MNEGSSDSIGRTHRPHKERAADASPREYAGSQIVRVPDRPGRYASGNNIYTSRFENFGKIPVIRYVCTDCGYTENWVENEADRAAVRRAFSG